MWWLTIIVAGAGGLTLSGLLWWEMRKRLKAEQRADRWQLLAEGWQKQAELEKRVAKGLGVLLKKRDEELEVLRDQLPAASRFRLLFPPPDTD